MLVALGIGLQAQEPAARAPSLAVLDLEDKAGTKQTAELITDVILNEVRASGRFSRVAASRDLAAVMSVEQQRQLMQCDGATCIAELGNALGVDLLLTGSVGRVGRYAVLNMKLVSTRSGAMVSTALLRVCADNAGELLPLIKPGVQQLLVNAQLQDGSAPTRLEQECSGAALPAQAVSAAQAVPTPSAGQDVSPQPPAPAGPAGFRLLPWAARAVSAVVAVAGLCFVLAAMASFGGAVAQFAALNGNVTEGEASRANLRQALFIGAGGVAVFMAVVLFGVAAAIDVVSLFV